MGTPAARALSLVALLSAASGLAAEPLPPPPGRWVTDEAGFLSPAAERALDAKLEAYERRTGHQVLVWIGRSTGGVPIEDWAVRTFERWRVGRAGIDDGLVLFVMAEDRRMRIEVGYGLEERVPDAVASRILREVLTPGLRAGQRDEAMTRAVDELLAAIEGQPVGGPEPPPARPAPRLGPLEVGFAVLLALAFLVLLITNPRMAMHLLFVLALRGGGGGGGRGGFRGGGGRSGGGGASGSW